MTSTIITPDFQTIPDFLKNDKRVIESLLSKMLGPEWTVGVMEDGNEQRLFMYKPNGNNEPSQFTREELNMFWPIAQKIALHVSSFGYTGLVCWSRFVVRRRTF